MDDGLTKVDSDINVCQTVQVSAVTEPYHFCPAWIKLQSTTGSPIMDGGHTALQLATDITDTSHRSSG